MLLHGAMACTRPRVFHVLVCVVAAINFLSSCIGWLRPPRGKAGVPYQLPGTATRMLRELHGAGNHRSGARVGRCASALSGHEAGSLSAACAIAASPALKRCAVLLNRINGLEGGGRMVDFLVSTAVDVINGTTEWDAARLDGELPAELAGEVLEAAEALEELFSLDDSGQPELRLTARKGSSIEGTHLDEPFTATLVETASNKMWGEFTSWEITEASLPAIQGKRILSCLGPVAPDGADGGGDDVEEVEMVPVRDAAAGDSLVVCDPDRAAIGEVISYDALPDQCESLAPLLKPDASEGFSEDFVDDLLEETPELREAWDDPEVREATRFAERLKMLPSPEDITRARLQRLSMQQVVRRVLVLARDDEELRTAMAVLEPYTDRLYDAAHRGQRDQFVAFQKVPLLPQMVSLTVLQAFGFLLVTAALAFIAAQIAKSSLRDLGERDLPVYSLQSDPGTA